MSSPDPPSTSGSCIFLPLFNHLSIICTKGYIWCLSQDRWILVFGKVIVLWGGGQWCLYPCIPAFPLSCMYVHMYLYIFFTYFLLDVRKTDRYTYAVLCAVFSRMQTQGDSPMNVPLRTQHTKCIFKRVILILQFVVSVVGRLVGSFVIVICGFLKKIITLLNRIFKMRVSGQDRRQGICIYRFYLIF